MAQAGFEVELTVIIPRSRYQQLAPTGGTLWPDSRCDDAARIRISPGLYGFESASRFACAVAAAQGICFSATGYGGRARGGFAVTRSWPRRSATVTRLGCAGCTRLGPPSPALVGEGGEPLAAPIGKLGSAMIGPTVPVTLRPCPLPTQSREARDHGPGRFARTRVCAKAYRRFPPS